jgi:hypothetical protein
MDLDVGAVDGFARALVDARTVDDLRRWALQGLAELVPADVLTRDRVALGTGAVRHEAVPFEAERPGAFEAIVGVAGWASDVRRPAPPIRRRVRDRDRRPRRVVRWSSPGGRTEREFSERDRDVLDLVRPGLEDALRAAEARGRLIRTRSCSRRRSRASARTRSTASG